jgi:hypothetical protein
MTPPRERGAPAAPRFKEAPVPALLTALTFIAGASLAAGLALLAARALGAHRLLRRLNPGRRGSAALIAAGVVCLAGALAVLLGVLPATLAGTAVPTWLFVGVVAGGLCLGLVPAGPRGDAPVQATSTDQARRAA